MPRDRNVASEHMGKGREQQVSHSVQQLLSSRTKLALMTAPDHWWVDHLLLHLQVGSLTMPAEFDAHFGNFFRMFMAQLMTIVPPDTNLPAAYDSGSDDQQAFVQNLALFFTGFFRVRLL